MLTARREESDKVLGLKSGADDYLTKPFGVREFLARLEALLRRPRSTWRTAPRPREQPAISLLGVTIDPEQHVVTCDGRTVSLTPQEFDLLYLLISHPGVVFDRDELLTRVWSDDVNVTHRGVDTLVKRLRRKIERRSAQSLARLLRCGALATSSPTFRVVAEPVSGERRELRSRQPGQLDREGRSVARRARGAHRSAVSVDDGLHDRQSESATGRGDAAWPTPPCRSDRRRAAGARRRWRPPNPRR